MENFETRMINRKVTVSFDHPKCVIATFKAQSTSFACQGQWRTEMVSIPKNDYSLAKLKGKVNEGFDVYYY